MGGYGFIPTFEDAYDKKYPDYPKALTTYQLLQTYVGKPIGAITPFLTPPQYKTLGSGTELERGNSGLAWTPDKIFLKQNVSLKLMSVMRA